MISRKRICHGPVDRQARQLGNFMLVLPADDNRVDLDRGDAGTFSGEDAIPNHVESAAPGHRLEALRVERIETDIDSIQPRIGQSIGHSSEQQRIGGHRDLLHARKALDGPDDIHQMRADGRLATGQPELGKAESGERADDPNEFLVGQDLVARLKLHAHFRHAVDAAEVAAVSERDPQIAHGSAVGVLRNALGGRVEPDRFRLGSRDHERTPMIG